ncbi:MAG: septum formation initiator [Veillonella sp.]|nr:septum formation initiator [Veillonella sp.]
MSSEKHVEKKLDPNRWNSQDRTWMLALFGTAIGAGVLFLPINAGMGGIYSFLFITLLVFPVTFYAHRGLAHFVGGAKNPEAGITGVIREYFGEKAQNVFNLVFFCALYTILLMYAVALTNTVLSIFENQFHIMNAPRSIVALALILFLLGIVQTGQQLIIKIMSYLVYPFIAMLLFVSVYLIPYWNGALFDFQGALTPPSGDSLIMTLWMTLPVLIFSFNHYPMISPLVVNQHKTYGDKWDKKAKWIQRNSYLLMMFVVLFFAYSCALALSPADLAQAKAENISILSYLANHLNTPIMVLIGPILALVAITKSFLGHYVGAYEAIRDLIIEFGESRGQHYSKKFVNTVIFAFMVVTCWGVAYADPSILGLIETVTGPLTALILIILPMYGIHKVKQLAKYRNKLSNYFITTIGILTIVAIIANML